MEISTPSLSSSITESVHPDMVMPPPPQRTGSLMPTPDVGEMDGVETAVESEEGKRRLENTPPPPSNSVASPVQRDTSSQNDLTSRLEVADFYNNADMNVLIFLVAEILDRLTAHNDRIPIMPSSITRFHSKRPAGISIIDYLRRIVKHGVVNRSCLLAVLVYMDRMCARNNTFMISSLTVHRFLITAVATSCKVHSDTYYSNKHYADVGGIPLRELNALELELVFQMNWDLLTTQEMLQ
ncbi:hypothetical protein HDU67_003092, partial [Dinochytrium kinnereticum]